MPRPQPVLANAGARVRNLGWFSILLFRPSLALGRSKLKSCHWHDLPELRSVASHPFFSFAQMRFSSASTSAASGGWMERRFMVSRGG